VARTDAERLNALGSRDKADVTLVESRVERVPPAVRITHVCEDRADGTRFETEPFTDDEWASYERAGTPPLCSRSPSASSWRSREVLA
jgi:hypothetical protein